MERNKMEMPKNYNMIQRLAEFHRNLGNYQSYRTIYLAKRLKEGQYREMMDLREWLVQKAGQLSAIITELTGKDKVTTYDEFRQQRSVDMWALGLRPKFDKPTSESLSICIDYTNRAIGKLADDIDRGVRDEQGNVIEKRDSTEESLPPKAFISHGKESVALAKLEEFLSTLGVEPLIVKEQASLDRTVDDKVEHYLNQADFVVILATADDEIDKKRHPRQNVIHEIGLAQKTHTGKIIYLLEEGAEFPSNISPKVWEHFKQRNMLNAFLSVVRELRAYGMLKIIKTPPEEHQP